MQRMKGQGTPVPNGPKDQNYSSFQNYSNAMTSTIPGPSDHYMSSFYMTSSPYQAFGVGDGNWSNGSEHMQTFLGGYGGQVGYDSHSAIDGIFNSGNFGGFNAPSFNYSYHGNGDYNAWGSDVRNNAKYDDYYQRGVYPDDHVKTIEQSVKGLTLDSKVGSDNIKDQLDGNAVSTSDKINDSSNNSDHAGISVLSQPKKSLSWASIASQPAKPHPSRRRDKTTLTSIVPGRHMDIGTWEGKNGGPKPVAPPPAPRPAWDAPRGVPRSSSSSYATPTPPPQAVLETAAVSSQMHIQHHPLTLMQQNSYQHPMSTSQHQIPAQFQQSQQDNPAQQPSTPQTIGITQSQPLAIPNNSTCAEVSGSPQAPENTVLLPQQSPPNDDNPILDNLQLRNVYNPKECEMCYENARFFVIKSYSEDDIHRSIKYEIWCSTEHGNKRLDAAFRERESKGPIFLFFSVNGSGHFCGIAQMISNVDYSSSSSVWAQDKWKGKFRVKWVYVKDVPNSQLRHIRLENNENKPVTNSRDTQEVPFDDGKQVIKIIHGYRHKTSIFDDFIHYEKRQEETEYRRVQHEVDRDVRRPDNRTGLDQRVDYNEHRNHRGTDRSDRDYNYHRGGPVSGRSRGPYHHRGISGRQ